MRKREKTVTIRVTETEKRKMERNARKRGLDLSSFLRQTALDQNLPAVDPKEFFSLIGEINAIRKIIPNVSDTTLDHRLEDLSSHLFRAMTNRKESHHGNDQDLAHQSVTLERR